jgi:hypothetical protein
MLRVFSEGDGVYRLEDESGTHVGTIRNRAISFRDFATEMAARDAAVAAWRAMNDALRRVYPSWPHHELALERLGTTHDGAYEWFYDGKRAIARLTRPRLGGRERTYGIELVLPSYSSEGVAIAASQGMARAVAPYRTSLASAAVERDTRHPSAPAGEILGARPARANRGPRERTRRESRRTPMRDEEPFAALAAGSSPVQDTRRIT